MFMNDSAEYWVDGGGSLLCLKFPARLDLSGQFNHICPYLNMPSTGLDVTVLKRAQLQFELCPLHESDPLSSHYLQEALDCLARALDTLITLTNKVEDACNAYPRALTMPHLSRWDIGSLAQLEDTRVDSPDVYNEHGVLLNRLKSS
ncbi:hypothetical protein BDR07DRAFT_1380052 [Suillus spraguei]|nr:hypothetical protein BDR07DRAFT_1380052 [Suillus spraguei]